MRHASGYIEPIRVLVVYAYSLAPKSWVRVEPFDETIWYPTVLEFGEEYVMIHSCRTPW